MKIDYSEKGQLNFYREMNRQRNKIRRLDISLEEKEKLYAQADENIKFYEERITSFFRYQSKINKLDLELEKLVKTVINPHLQIKAEPINFVSNEEDLEGANKK